jgi:GDP-4-dehydro-6-deoxy-D-mannose reductase
MAQALKVRLGTICSRMPVDVLLTGAGGFVGRHLVERASARGLEIVCVEGDLRDPQVARRSVAAAHPKAVIHLASTMRRREQPWIGLSDDVLMTGNLITAIGDLAPGAILLVPGSAAQYGDGGSGRLRENAPTKALTPYGEAKCVLERACMSSPLVRELRVIFTRTFNHVGPGQGTDAPIAAWARQLAQAEAARGGAVNTGRLDVHRDFLDVRDVADAYLDLVLGNAEGIVNVCSGTAVVLEDVARLLLRLVAVPVSLEADPALYRSIDPAVVVGDPTRLKRLTGFRPRIRLEQSLADVLEEHRARVIAEGIIVGRG